MKKMRRIAGLALVLVLVLSLCACGAKPEKALMGSWRYEYDYTHFVTDEMPAEMMEFMPKNARLVMPIDFTFKENMTYSAVIDTDASIASINAYMDEMVAGMIELVYITGEEEGISREDMAAMVEEAYGMDIESYCRETMEESIDLESLVEELDVAEIGDWKVKDGRLYLDENEEGFSDSAYFSYTVDGETLIFTENVGNVMGLEDLEMEYPMVMTRK